MEDLILRMQEEKTGLPIKTVKSFMTKIPSVFTGLDAINWLQANLSVEDQTEAHHLANMLASHGYFFPIDDHVLAVKADGSALYRFQTRYFWPSNCWGPENTDYAVYLCKRTMLNKARLELADYEAENLARLQKMFSRKWEFIFMQAEAQSKIDKKREKQERKILDSQERAFWDLHRPQPGQINTTELDIKVILRLNHIFGVCSEEDEQESEGEQLTRLQRIRDNQILRRDRRTIKLSKCGDSYIEFYNQYQQYDALINPQDCTSPWATESTEVWEGEKCAKDLPARRIKRWAFSGWELLKDPIGREHFHTFLEREYATENLLFVESVWHMKKMAEKDVAAECHRIWNRFMGSQAEIPINLDSKSFKITEENMKNPDRWTFEIACAHLYYLMTSDSYSRYVRSSHYKEFLDSAKKKNGRSFINMPKLSSAKLNIVNAKEQIKVGLSGGNSFPL